MTECGSEPIHWETVAGRSLHPTQLATLQLIAGPHPNAARGWTINELAKEIGVPVHQERHHVSILVSRKLLTVVKRSRVAGAGAFENQYGLSSQARLPTH